MHGGEEPGIRTSADRAKLDRYGSGVFPGDQGGPEPAGIDLAVGVDDGAPPRPGGPLPEGGADAERLRQVGQRRASDGHPVDAARDDAGGGAEMTTPTASSRFSLSRRTSFSMLPDASKQYNVMAPRRDRLIIFCAPSKTGHGITTMPTTSPKNAKASLNGGAQLWAPRVDEDTIAGGSKKSKAAKHRAANKANKLKRKASAQQQRRKSAAQKQRAAAQALQAAKKRRQQQQRKALSAQLVARATSKALQAVKKSRPQAAKKKPVRKASGKKRGEVVKTMTPTARRLSRTNKEQSLRLRAVVCARRASRTLCKTTTKPTKAYCGKKACADRISKKTGKPMQTIPGVQQAKKKVRNMQLLKKTSMMRQLNKKSMQKRKSQQKKPQQHTRASRANGKRKPRLIQTIQGRKLAGGEM